MPKLEKAKLLTGDKLSALGVKPLNPEMLQAVIVKVTKPGYVPAGLAVRTRVDDLFFTAECKPAALDALRLDDAVESISPATPLRQIG